MNKSGNRQLNAALHRIAITQVRLGGLGRAYYDKRLAAGDTKTEALRCLKRRLARVVYNTLKNQTTTSQPPPHPHTRQRLDIGETHVARAGYVPTTRWRTPSHLTSTASPSRRQISRSRPGVRAPRGRAPSPG
ncbi:hypothetical protein GCM10022262_34750 [Georgenia daeguensis]|uniref:Transposase n=2 Tax=Georgenia daeguensis TaxID=908355 RepID=A0ABP8EYQ5_9MICO